MKNHSRPILAWSILCLSFLLSSGCQPEDSYAEDPHADLSYQDYPTNCLKCHTDQASEVHASTHYQWLGEAPDMANGSFILQGKLTNAVNSYCINIEGNWPVCGSCHVGRGKRPDDPNVGYENIDCLMCHTRNMPQVEHAWPMVPWAWLLPLTAWCKTFTNPPGPIAWLAMPKPGAVMA